MLFADFEQLTLIWMSANVRSCALQYVFLSTKSAFGFWSHYALEVVEKVHFSTSFLKIDMTDLWSHYALEVVEKVHFSTSFLKIDMTDHCLMKV